MEPILDKPLKKKKKQSLEAIHEESMQRFNEAYTVGLEERQLCLMDRRIATIPGAMWEGEWAKMFDGRPRYEVNLIQRSLIRIYNEYRNNRITVDYISKDGEESKLADLCDDLYRAVEQDSNAIEAYDNAFDEASAGGFGAWRLSVSNEDEYSEEEKLCVRIHPIFDADQNVWFDTGSRQQDKRDATWCWLLRPIPRSRCEEMGIDDPSSWPVPLLNNVFDWARPDVVYISETYKVEDRQKVIITYRLIDGSTEDHDEEEFEEDEELAERLTAVGSVELSRRTVRTRAVRKYLETGNKIIEDYGYIAGKLIPIVPVYGKRWFISDIERMAGHARYVKDVMRVLNMQISKLAEISAASMTEIPILFAEQVSDPRLKKMWAEAPNKRFSHMLINPVTDSDGKKVFLPPTAYTKSAVVPPALGALMQVVDQYTKDILGDSAQSEKMVSNISGKAVEMIQERIDAQAYIYMSNFAKGMSLSGSIALGMYPTAYKEEGRKVKVVDQYGGVSSVELNRPVMGDDGMEFENDLSQAKFDVVANVGPSSSSKKNATVRALTQLAMISTDPESKTVYELTALMNMEIAGADAASKWARSRLVKMGVEEPNEEEKQAMEEAAQNQPPDPNRMYLEAAAEKERATATKAKAETILTIAKSEQTKADTVKTLADIDINEQKQAIATAQALGDALNLSEDRQAAKDAANPQPSQLGETTEIINE